jgi:hypothetical protein
VTTEDDGCMGFEPIRVFVHHYVKRAWAAYHGWPNVSMEFGFKEIKIGSGYPNGHKAHESSSTVVTNEAHQQQLFQDYSCKTHQY